MDASITCPRCGMTSHNPNDVRAGYCGNCHDWTSPLDEEVRRWLVEKLSATPSPASSPVALGRFFREASEMGVDPSFFATNPDLSR